MGVNKTILSAGEIIASLLRNDTEVRKRAKKVFPILSEKALLPYIAYHRNSLEVNPVKGPSADTAFIQIDCFAAKYEESVELAEAVRAALDNQTPEQSGMRMRCCYLSDASEDRDADAFIQSLTFTIKI